MVITSAYDCVCCASVNTSGASEVGYSLVFTKALSIIVFHHSSSYVINQHLFSIYHCLIPASIMFFYLPPSHSIIHHFIPSFIIFSILHHLIPQSIIFSHHPSSHSTPTKSLCEDTHYLLATSYIADFLFCFNLLTQEDTGPAYHHTLSVRCPKGAPDEIEWRRSTEEDQQTHECREEQDIHSFTH